MLFSIIVSLFFGIHCGVPPDLHQSNQVFQVDEFPNSWEAWLQDAERMEWWRLNGWGLLSQVKPNTPLYKQGNTEVFPLDPLTLGLTPHSSKPIQWAFRDGSGVHLHCLQRCEVLYQRFLINEEAKAKSISS